METHNGYTFQVLSDSQGDFWANIFWGTEFVSTILGLTREETEENAKLAIDGNIAEREMAQHDRTCEMCFHHGPGYCSFTDNHEADDQEQPEEEAEGMGRYSLVDNFEELPF